jgi:predicted DNA-binding transcriptional regulator AlpA
MPSNKTDFRFDLDNLPPLLRERDICRDPKTGHAGLLPLTRSAFRDLIEAGHIPGPIRLGNKVIAWPSAIILEIIRNGTGDRRARGRQAKKRAAARRKALADIKAEERSQRATTSS